MKTDLDPPRPLTLAARQVWNRNAERIHKEGRWKQIDHELLAVFAETLELYLKFKADLDEHGTLIQGRSLQEKVRNPSIIGMSQCRADLLKLAKGIPLANPTPDKAAAELDAFISEMATWE